MIALIFAFVSSRGARANMIWLLSSLLLVVFIQMMLFKHLHWWVPSSPSILTILLLGIMSIFHDSILVNRQLSALAQQVGRFIPDTIARRLIRGRDYSPGTEERELTVLVADMRGFTTASEGREPEKVAALAQKCLETLTQVVYQYGGTIEKFSGDGLMAIWGAPKRDAYHAKNAFDAGLMMLKKIEGLQTWFEQNGFEPMQVSIGMNTGKMAVGVFGGDSHLAWSAHGDAVNVASRIEQLTREVGLPILLGARTAELIGIDLLQYCGEFKVKGRQQTVQVYSPMQQ
jgi:adenylate cyclase